MHDGHCATCFKRVFPADPRSTYIPSHAKEIRVRNEIMNHFGTSFIHDKPMYTGECNCSMRRRIDHRKVIRGTLLGVETDEDCHRHYSPEDERNRYDDIFMVHGGPMIFIRFNPDLKGIGMQRKLDALIDEMKRQIAFIESGETYPNGFLKEIKLFYNDLPHRYESTL